MEQDDTIQLLCECDNGIKLAVNSIDELTEHATEENLKEVFKRYRKEHEAIGKRIQDMLAQYKEDGKDPTAMTKAMSWLKINAKMMQKPTDHEVADLMMDGCNMGIKSICKYQNMYKSANEKVKALAKDIIELDEKLMLELRPYL